MVTVRYAIFADSVSFGSDGKAVIVGPFDTLFVKSVPATHPQMFFLCRLEIPADSPSMRVLTMHLITPSGAEIEIVNDDTFAFPDLQHPYDGMPKGANMYVEFENFGVQDLGRHDFVLKLDGTQVGIAELWVVQVETEEAT